MPPGQPWVEVDELRAKIDAHRPFTPGLVERMQRWLVPQFLWASEAISGREGLSLAETTAFVEREACSGGHPLERYLALQRHRAALGLAEQRAREGGVIDVDLLKGLHRALYAGARGVDRAGDWKLRESPETRRRGRAFRFASPEAVPALVDRLVAGYRERLAADHPLRAITWLYYHLHTVHPFEQGNGPVARLAATAALLHHGYPPLILDARDPGPYLDALAACDATVPPGEAELLSPKVEVLALLGYFSACLERTARRLLGFVEGKDVGAGDVPEQVAADQHRLLEAMLAEKDLSWRVRGSFEVRALHERTVRFARALVTRGPLYAIEVESVDVVRTHAVWREFSTFLPAGDAGVVGQLEVVIKGDASTNLRFAEAPRLRVVVTCSQVGAQLLLLWDDERRPKAHPGPPRSEEWPDAAIDRLLTKAVDGRRRAFEMRLVDDNLSAQARARIAALLEEQPGRETLRLRRVTQAFPQAPYRTRSGRLAPIAPLTEPSAPAPAPAGARTPQTTRRPGLVTPPATRRPPAADDPSLDAPAARATPPADAPPGAGPRATRKLDGLSPAEPPLSF